MSSFQTNIVTAVAALGVSVASLSLPVDSFAHGAHMGSNANRFENSRSNIASSTFTSDVPTVISGIPTFTSSVPTFTSIAGAPMMMGHPGMRP